MGSATSLAAILRTRVPASRPSQSRMHSRVAEFLLKSNGTDGHDEVAPYAQSAVFLDGCALRVGTQAEEAVLTVPIGSGCFRCRIAHRHPTTSAGLNKNKTKVAPISGNGAIDRMASISGVPSRHRLPARTYAAWVVVAWRRSPAQEDATRWSLIKAHSTRRRSHFSNAAYMFQNLLSCHRRRCPTLGESGQPRKS